MSSSKKHTERINRYNKSASPCVGIFFVKDGQIFLEYTPVEKAEAVAGYIDHQRGHEEYWEILQTMQLVPQR